MRPGQNAGDENECAGTASFSFKKKDGEFVRISWEQALDEIAEKMAVIKETLGTAAVLHSHDYANNGLLKALDQRFSMDTAV